MLGLGTLRNVIGEVASDVATARERDPAARRAGTVEILASWAGVQALLAYRVSHALSEAEVPLAPMSIAYLSRAVTGVEIHPAARIGCVTLYQGVTLGGTGSQRGKRHPTLGDNVTVGSGAKLLGPIEVGHGAKVGANTVVVEDVPPNSTVVGNPGHTVRVDGRKVEGPDTDWIHLPDPIADAIRGLSERIAELEGRLAELTGEKRPDSKVSEIGKRTGRSSAGG
jgi:serine O-acetyltransferase